MAGYIGSKSSVTLVDGYNEAEADAEFVTKTGDSMTGNLSLGDNNKAIFGAGSDLQIYHDGSNSYIDDSDTGSLRLRSNRLRIEKYTGENMIEAYGDGAVELFHNGTKKFETTSTGIAVTQSGTDVGLLVTGGSYNFQAKFESTDAEANIIIEDSNSTNNANMIGVATNDMYFVTNTSERMRINGSGEILIGKTSAASSTVGAQIIAGGISQFGRSGAEALRLTRTTNDGDILQFQRNDTLVGSIGTGYGGATQFGIQSHTGDLRFSAANNVVTWDGTQFYPAASGSKNLGHPSHRWEDAWVVNGVTTGSDANDKQDIATLTDTEMLVAARLSQTFRTYRWKDKVVEKGDNARTHTGTIAQEVQSAFTAEGLDAGDYAMFMSDTWWEHDVDVPAVEAVAEVTDEDGNVTTEAVEAVDAYTRTDTYDTEDEAPEGATSKTRLAIRYHELLSFVAAYNEQRFASIEARLTALEA